MATYSVTINGVERDCRLSAFTIQMNLNRVPTFVGEFISQDASFRPNEDDEILITEDTGTSPVEIIFAGLIESPEESAPDGQVADGIDAIVTRVEASGYGAYADWRYVDIALPAGTLKSILELLEAFVTGYGVVLDPLQETGPNIEALDYSSAPRKFSDVLNDLSSLSTGSGGSPDIPYVWEIDFTKTLRMYQLGSRTAPTNLIEGDAVEVGDLVIRKSNRGTANRVILRSGNGALTTIANDLVAQGSPPILKEALIETAADLPQATATQAAEGLLQQFSLVQKEARYSTRVFGLQVGQIQTITSAKRNVNGPFLITEVVTRQDPDNLALRRWITAIEGYRLQGSWMDILSRWTTGTGGVGTIGLPGAGGVGSVPGGGVSGGGATCDCCEAVCAGAFVFSGFGGGNAPVEIRDAMGAELLLTTPAGLGDGTAVDAMVALDNGKYAIVGGIDTPSGDEALVYAADLQSFVGEPITRANYSIAQWGNNYYTFEVGNVVSVNAQVRKRDDTGAVVTSFDLGTMVNQPHAIGINSAETIVYFGQRGAKLVSQRTGGVTSTFIDETANNYLLRDNAILVLTGGDVIIIWHKTGAPGLIRRYTAAGATVTTYTPSVGAAVNYSPVVLTRANQLKTQIAVSYYAPTNLRVDVFDVASGAILASFEPTNGGFDFDSPFCVAMAKATP